LASSFSRLAWRKEDKDGFGPSTSFLRSPSPSSPQRIILFEFDEEMSTWVERRLFFVEEGKV